MEAPVTDYDDHPYIRELTNEIGREVYTALGYARARFTTMMTVSDLAVKEASREGALRMASALDRIEDLKRKRDDMRRKLHDEACEDAEMQQRQDDRHDLRMEHDRVDDIGVQEREQA